MNARSIYHVEKVTLNMPTIGLNKFKPADLSKMINHFLNESLRVSLKRSMIRSLSVSLKRSIIQSLSVSLKRSMIACLIYHAQKVTLYIPAIGLNKFKPADPSKMINHFLNESLSVSLKSSLIVCSMEVED